MRTLSATTTKPAKATPRHYGELEEPYAFTGVEQLIEDFRNDCARLAGWEWDT